MHDLNRRELGLGVASVALVAAGAGAAAGQVDRPIVRIRYGQVRGFRRNNADIFLGLPYGASTSGALRFMPPAPPARWSDVRDASALGQRAPQRGDPIYKNATYGEYLSGGRAQELIALNEPMGENCLVLNVLTPRADNARRPVMVYIHGGGFATGSGAVHTLGDHFVAEQDVVLVTVNHRLSALGYLYLGELSPRYANANPGMLDLVAALRWVRDNVAAFGGDPSKVTIFGESGGGAKVGLLLSMPQAKGLFRAAIIESSGGNGTVAPEKATANARALLASLNVGESELARLHTMPFESFIPAPGGGPGGGGPTPVGDGKTLALNPWANGAPATCAAVPLIVGYCKDEATLFTGLPDRSLFELADWPTVVLRLSYMTKKPEAALEPVVSAYRAVYPNDSPTRLFFRIASVATAPIGFDGALIAAAKARQPANVYYYRNEYDTQITPGIGAFHTCELPLATRMVMQPRAENLSKQIAGAWAGFARTGDPNHTGLPRWEPFHSGDNGQIMIFDIESRAGPDREASAQRMLREVLGASGVPVGTRATPTAAR